MLGTCVIVAGAAIAAVLLTRDGSGSSQPPLPTTGQWAPIKVTRPDVPIIGGGIPVDIDPLKDWNNFATTLSSLSGTHRYRLNVSNVSSLGVINSFQWYPPPGVQIVKVVGSTRGHCTATGLTGFGGNQFPTVVLYPNILCDQVALKAPSCTCQGDGGTMDITFVTDKAIEVGSGDTKMRSADLQVDRIPAFLPSAATASTSG